MADLIDRNALIQDLKEHKIPFNADINEAIIVAPTVDPVKHGRWLERNSGLQKWIRCSSCGSKQHYTNKTNYCPNCGAKMTLD